VGEPKATRDVARARERRDPELVTGRRHVSEAEHARVQEVGEGHRVAGFPDRGVELVVESDRLAWRAELLPTLARRFAEALGVIRRRLHAREHGVAARGDPLQARAQVFAVRFADDLLTFRRLLGAGAAGSALRQRRLPAHR
jgi:hypothetical protein